jgi:hypothetical protein
MYNSRNGSVIKRIALMRTYEQAVAVHNNIKPIKGRAVECRPLADRRHDQYSIRMNRDKVECVLYRTPVLTFLPDNTVEICMGGYNSVSTRAFIMEILGLNCGARNGTPILDLDRDRHVVLDVTQPTVIAWVSRFPFLHWELVSSTPVFEWQMNKAKANIVRAKYSEFEAYFRSMIKLRKEKTNMMNFAQFDVINFNVQEFKDSGVLIEGEVNRWSVAVQKGQPRYHHLNEFLTGMMANGQPEEGQIKCFYMAVMRIVASLRHVATFGAYARETVPISTDALLPRFREIVYKWHSDEMFDKVQLPVGKAPSSKYNSWVNY